MLGGGIEMWIRSQNKRCLIEVNQVGETNGKNNMQ